MALAKAVARLMRRPGPRPVVDEKPGCAYGMVNRRALDDLEQAFARLEAKVNGVLLGIVATVAIEIWRSVR
ncbi:MAG: hypothetical protein M1370_11690 [Bacteroidetes bacterium]|nr:hypothetical protein [Bacteroidota bacterium]MCL5025742.1 hypothetical protein [Chloroflexota bacterium]